MMLQCPNCGESASFPSNQESGRHKIRCRPCGAEFEVSVEDEPSAEAQPASIDPPGPSRFGFLVVWKALHLLAAGLVVGYLVRSFARTFRDTAPAVSISPASYFIVGVSIVAGAVFSAAIAAAIFVIVARNIRTMQFHTATTGTILGRESGKRRPGVSSSETT
jgi:hypothetical protein